MSRTRLWDEDRVTTSHGAQLAWHPSIPLAFTVCLCVGLALAHLLMFGLRLEVYDNTLEALGTS